MAFACPGNDTWGENAICRSHHHMWRPTFDQPFWPGLDLRLDGLVWKTGRAYQRSALAQMPDSQDLP